MSEEKSESKDLVVKTFTNDSLTKYESYGGKSLVENLQNAELAVNKVKYTERIWDRSRSQFMLKHLTCSQADDWTRLRQVSAEMASKRMALNEGSETCSSQKCYGATTCRPARRRRFVRG